MAIESLKPIVIHGIVLELGTPRKNPWDFSEKTPGPQDGNAISDIEVELVRKGANAYGPSGGKYGRLESAEIKQRALWSQDGNEIHEYLTELRKRGHDIHISGEVDLGEGYDLSGVIRLVEYAGLAILIVELTKCLFKSSSK